jgi:hypothetical protein
MQGIEAHGDTGGRVAAETSGHDCSKRHPDPVA